MKTLATISEATALCRSWRLEGQKIVLVATMGNLHEAHLSLVRQAKTLGERVVVTIYVNPKQFAPNEDFATYPRTLETDKKKLTDLGVDLLFAPSSEEMYPNGTDIVTVSMPGLSDDLCGITRPKFFYGITTIGTKLFAILMPDIAIFGEKDYQQFIILKNLVNELHFPIDIVSAPIVREKHGLALSSRNQYLSEQEFHQAGFVYETLQWVASALHENNKSYEMIEQLAKKHLVEKGFKTDYVAIRATKDLSHPKINERSLIILVAAYLGKTRLIDNLKVELPQ